MTRHRIGLAWYCALQVFLVMGWLCAAGRSEELRLHLAWGGGQDRQWQGRLTSATGQFRDLRLLGVASDTPGSMTVRGQQILIRQRSPRDYDGFEVSLSAPLDTSLRMELLPQGEIKAVVVDVPLRDLVDGYRSEPIDEQGNRLVIRRSPEDRLPVEHTRDHLVFRPDEEFEVRLRPRRLDFDVDSRPRFVARLHAVNSRELLWEVSRQPVETGRETDEYLSLDPFQFKVPTTEGVYELEFTAQARRRAAPFSPERVLTSRKLQFVVVAEGQSSEPSLAEPRLVAEIDPSQRNWWQRMTRLPQWSLLPGFRSEGPLGNVKAETVEHTGRTWTRLPIGSWQAYPLPIEAIGEAHEVEIDLPGDLVQAFTVSIIEPNAAGKVMPIGIDSGVEITPDDVQGVAVRSEQVTRHRVLFWPRTKSPLILVTNVSPDRPAVIGRFRVTNLGARLRPEPVTASPRAAFAYFERPLFAELFGAVESYDASTGRSLEDWTTFHQGADRLAQYLRHVGYDGVVMPCVSEGGTLYPSQLLQSVPRHDRGVFFSSGQDPVPKDVIELLFRVLDRESLKLVLSIEFVSPLPQLEEHRWQRADDLTGLELVDASGAEYHERYGNRRGATPNYNPLDPRVQDAMVAVVRELVARYGHHPSFGGISIAMECDGYTQMPDIEWGMDDVTIARFQRDTGVQLANGPSRGTFSRSELLHGPSQTAWRQWRCQQIAKLYHRMANELERCSSDKQLFLASARLIESRPIQRAMRPTLPRRIDVDRFMKDLGLDLQLLQQNPRVVVLRPQLLSPMQSLANNGANVEFNLSEEVDRYFGQYAHSASQLLHEPHRLRLPSFDQLSPFGEENTFISLVAQMSPTGAAQRRRFVHALATADSRTIFDGGWLLLLGQEDLTRELLRVYRQLPAQPSQSFEGDVSRTQPVRIRMVSVEDHSVIWLVNDSAWTVGASVKLEVSESVAIEQLGITTPPTLSRDSGMTVWNASLEPYGLAAIRLKAPRVVVADAQVTLPPDVVPGLRTQIVGLGRRAALLRNPPTHRNLVNAGFEQPASASDPVPGWSFETSQEHLTIDRQDAFEGQQALRLMTENETFSVRSQPVQPPESGRLSVSIRAKAVDASQQPTLRLELIADGKLYYPWAPLGQTHPDRAMSDEWKEFVFRVDKLPAIKSDLAIGIELSGRGSVMVDDVKVFDIVVLDDTEQKELAHILSVAGFQLQKGFVGDCLRSLSGYWPRYLLTNVPEEIVELADRQLKTTNKSEETPPPKPSAWNPFRRFAPQLYR